MNRRTWREALGGQGARGQLAALTFALGPGTYLGDKFFGDLFADLREHLGDCAYAEELQDGAPQLEQTLIFDRPAAAF